MSSPPAISAASATSLRAPAFRLHIPSSCSTGRRAVRSLGRYTRNTMAFLRTCLAALLGVMLGANVLAQNGGSSTMLDTLFAKLRTATDPVAIQSLESAIWEQWIMVPEGEQRQLMLRGIVEMQQRQLR